MMEFLDGKVQLISGDCIEAMNGMDENSVDAISFRPHGSAFSHRALEVGKAAEHIVCADLILSGHRAFLTDQGLPYDVVFDHGGRLLRVQVKSTTRPRPVPGRPGSGDNYSFNIRRAGKGGRRKIENGVFDLIALVALDIRVIAYIPVPDHVRQLIHLRVPGCHKAHGNKIHGNIDDYPIEKALSEMGL